MQKIVPHLWFDTEAKEAGRFYTKSFQNSSIKRESRLFGTPSGDVDLLTIELAGSEFMLISAGPFFKFTPAVSFVVACETAEEVDHLWKKLGESGTELMPLGRYPFSERYAWIQDKYGLSWQILCTGQRPKQQKITPSLLFVGDQCGRSEEAFRLYTSIFRNSQVGEILRYGPSDAPERESTVKHASFRLENQEFSAMDSALGHDFSFNEAISFVVRCGDQKDVDYYWDALTADPEAEQCGWLKDKFGFSWQVVPILMEEIFEEKDQKKLTRVAEAFLKMKKFDIAEIKKAAEG